MVSLTGLLTMYRRWRRQRGHYEPARMQVPVLAIPARVGRPTAEPRPLWSLVASGRVTSRFGWRVHPITREPRMHFGVDIAAPLGSPVRCLADGVVVVAGWLRGFGLTAGVAHNAGMVTYYAHLSAINVHVGQRIGAGEVVGAVGRTGAATGAHVHFEVRIHGTAVDPERVFGSVMLAEAGL